MGKSMSLLKHDNASDNQQDQVNNNEQCEVGSNNEHDQATINNLSKVRQNNPNRPNQIQQPNTINMPPITNQQEGQLTQQGGLNTSDKENQKICCKNRLTRMQCVFLITGIILFTAGFITLGILLAKSWVKNSITAKATPVYKVHFVTNSGKHVRTDKVIVDQKFLFGEQTQDIFLVTTIKQPTIVRRTLQQFDTATIANDNIPAFVTITDGAVTAKAANSGDITLLVNVNELKNQLKGTGSEWLLQGSDSKKQLFDQIKKIVAEKAEVDPSQVSVVEETYIKLVADEKGELVAEEVQPSRKVDEAKVATNSSQTKQQSNDAKGTVKALEIIGKSFVDAKDKMKKHEKRIAEQTKCGFKSTNDLLIRIEVTKKIGENHIQIRREYEEGLNRKPKNIKNTIVISAEECEAFKHCFDHKDGKYCVKRFIDRVDNPFKISNDSRNRQNLHQKHIFYRITVHDKRDIREKIEHEKHTDAVVPSAEQKQNNSNKDEKQTKPADKKKAEEKQSADIEQTNSSTNIRKEQSSKSDSKQPTADAQSSNSSAKSNQKV